MKINSLYLSFERARNCKKATKSLTSSTLDLYDANLIYIEIRKSSGSIPSKKDTFVQPSNFNDHDFYLTQLATVLNKVDGILFTMAPDGSIQNIYGETFFSIFAEFDKTKKKEKIQFLRIDVNIINKKSISLEVKSVNQCALLTYMFQIEPNLV